MRRAHLGSARCICSNALKAVDALYPTGSFERKTPFGGKIQMESQVAKKSSEAAGWFLGAGGARWRVSSRFPAILVMVSVYPPCRPPPPHARDSDTDEARAGAGRNRCAL